MATNRFWASGVGRWIASTKNLLGSAFGAFALVGQLILGFGPLWLPIVIAAYCAGALIAPRDPVELHLVFGAGASASQLQEQLALIRTSAARNAKQLGPDAHTAIAELTEGLGEVIGRWGELDALPEQAQVVEAIIGDYLPTSVQTYINLPRTFAITPAAGKRSAHDELMEQLALLRAETDRVRTALYTRDADALGDQGRFLRNKFGRSELEL